MTNLMITLCTVMNLVDAYMYLSYSGKNWFCKFSSRLLHMTSVMIYHRGVSLSKQHTDLLCTKQDLSHTSRYVDESSPEIVRYRIRMPTVRTATCTLSVTDYTRIN